MTASGYTTRGRRSGACGHVHPDEPSALACLAAYQAEREAEGGKSDRRVVPWSKRGVKPAAGVAAEVQVQVRLTPDQLDILDAVKGSLSRQAWFRAQLPSRKPDP